MTEHEAEKRVQAAERQRDLARTVAAEAMRELTDEQLIRLRRRLDGEAEDDACGDSLCG